MMSGSLPFALVVETQPMQTSDWWIYVQMFLQDAGAFALLGLWTWLLFSFARAFVPAAGGPRRGIPVLVLAVAVAALALYAIGGISGLLAYYSQRANQPPNASMADTTSSKWYFLMMNAGGALALLGVFVPFLLDA